VTGVQDRCRKAGAACLPQKICLDGGFIDAILPEGTPGLSFHRRHLDAGTVNPNRAAMQEVLHLPPQRLNQELGTFEFKTNHINDYIGCQFSNLIGEGACLLSLSSINFHLPHRLPGSMGLVWCALLPADRDHFMPCLY
jgi:hypothetical protein